MGTENQMGSILNNNKDIIGYQKNIKNEKYVKIMQN